MRALVVLVPLVILVQVSPFVLWSPGLGRDYSRSHSPKFSHSLCKET